MALTFEQTCKRLMKIPGVTYVKAGRDQWMSYHGLYGGYTIAVFKGEELVYTTKYNVNGLPKSFEEAVEQAEKELSK